jgi:hypothetical protein
MSKDAQMTKRMPAELLDLLTRMIVLGHQLPPDGSDYDDEAVYTQAKLVCAEMKQVKKRIDQFLSARH